MVELVDTQDLGSCAARRVGSSPTTRTITEPTVDTIIDCRFVIFMRETTVISRLFHSEMHPFIYRPPKREIHCYRWTFDYRKQSVLRCKEPGIVGLFCP